MRRDVGAARSRAMARLRGADDGVAMLTALLLIMVLAALSILVLGIVVNQVKPTLYAEKNTRTIYGAEAGVEAALGRIRNATSPPDFTGTVYGDPRKLPCTLSGVLDASSASFDVTVRYFAENPGGQSDTWLASHALTCSAGTGTGTVLPAYALIESHAQDTSYARVASTQGDRAISMVYTFRTTTTNIKGGRIWSWNDGAQGQFCLRADTTAAGSSVKYQSAVNCGFSANEDRELWIYDTDYTIKLASSTLTATPLCLTTESGGAIRLRSCATPTYTQLWSWHSGGNATWQGQDSGIRDNKTCLGDATRTTGTPSAGDLLGVGACQDKLPTGSFAPDPAVGPGAASVNTHQIVNYLEFGRCMDVTDTHTWAPFMISYPCKQDPPAAAELYWNHRWYYEEPLFGAQSPVQLIYVYNEGGVQYCLQRPTSMTNPGASGVDKAAYYPTLTSTCNINDVSQQWVRNKDTKKKATSYTFTDPSLTQCIGVSGMRYYGKWSALVMSACDGSTAQKWNAPGDDVNAKVGNYLEERD